MTKVLSLSGLPVVSPQIRQSMEVQEQAHGEAWASMILRQLKEENPEINSVLLSLAKVSTDPKSVILAGYKVYKLLEMAEASERRLWSE